MTLVLGMLKPEGIYVSVDYRVTSGPGRKLVDDLAVKHLDVRYPPDKGGPRAILAYTGIAEISDGTSTGDWIRETLRGESESFDDSMRHLNDRINRDFRRYRQPLIVVVAVQQGDRRFFGGHSNVKQLSQSGIRIRPNFRYHMEEVQQGFHFVTGSGSWAVAGSDDLALLADQAQTKPRRTLDHMKLLASINRRAAAHDKSVSPHCHVAFSSAQDDKGTTVRVFTEPGDPVIPVRFPMITFGIDMDELTSEFARNSQRLFDGEIDELPPNDTDDTINSRLQRRP